MKDRIDLESREYNVSEVPNYDTRFEKSKKSALFLHVLGIAASIIGTSWMFFFGTGDPEKMTYFLGFPLWFSGAAVIYTIMTIIGVIHIWKWEEFSLTAKESEREVKK